MPVFDPADPPANLWPEMHTVDLERLRYWREKRAAEEERRRVAEVLFRRDLGQELTDADRAVLAYSPWGTAAGCVCEAVAPQQVLG